MLYVENEKNKKTGEFEVFYEDYDFQIAGDDSLSDNAFINRQNRNIYQVPVGQFCVQIIRSKEKECPRSLNGSSKNCTPVRYDPDNLKEEDLSFFTEDGEDRDLIKSQLQWVPSVEHNNEIEGEVSSSKFLDGQHGEYNLAKGHFHCWDPYPDASTLEE